MRTILCTLALLLGMSTPARAIDIERIEPTNWWVGMRHNRVELLVHGTGIATSTPRLSRAGVAIVDVQKTDNPNYLFVTVEIAGDAIPGGIDIEFVHAGKVVATHPWRLDAREPG
ncbi:MAG TPA: cyclomaltodextrinase N-terminal domain-containing protein, partial [Thermomonas sp.]|nr:cyclomaltodextrinase N-terminal domain-containing protein [Thermomonas sp.]